MTKRTARWFLATSIGAVLLLVVGNARDPWLWAYIAVFAAVGLNAITSMSDELARERFNPPSRGADSLALRWVRLVALAHVIAGVADSRFGWTFVPDPLRALGIIGFGFSFVLVTRAMLANRFFSAVVRIQNERGHLVVDTGPYAVVRHPGYAGMILFAPFSGLALGSWIAVAAGFVYSALILRRVRFEDRFLRAHLEGYEAYAARVPYRLVPRVW